MMHRLQRWAPTDTWVRWAIVPILVFVAMSVNGHYLKDFWHHLARGQAMAQQGRIVNHDLFTYTVAGQEFQDVNWLTQLGYYALFQTGGLALVQCVNALLLAVTLLWLVALCRRRCGSLEVAMTAGIVTFLGIWQVLTIRPQTFSLLLFVVLFDVLDRAELRRRWLLLPPVLLALWVNLHGAFPAGLLLIGCFLAAAGWRAGRQRVWRDRQSQTLMLCLGASMLATLANPYGWKIYEYVGITSSRAADRQIVEWLPPQLDMLIGMAWLASMVLLIGLATAAWRQQGRRPTAREAFLVLCFLPLACRSVRMVPWWLIAFAPMFAELLARLCTRPAAESEPIRPSLGAAGLFGVLGAIAVLSVPGLQQWNPLLGFAPRQHAMEASLDKAHDYLSGQGGPKRIFTRFEWGEYLSWKCGPHGKLFMDARIEIIPDDIWEQYMRLTAGAEGWEKLLADYQVDFLVLDEDYHRENGLLDRVEQSPGWQRVLKDDEQVVVFQRVGAGGLAVAR
jgi:hypothetical protein